MPKIKLVLIEPHNIGRSDAFYTTSLFWDCECEENYIHSFTEETCPACGATREEAPDARVNEVISHSTGLNSALVAASISFAAKFAPISSPSHSRRSAWRLIRRRLSASSF